MTIAQALTQFPTIENDLLLAHTLKVSKEFLYMHRDKKLTPKQVLQYTKLCKKRNTGVPIAYLIGKKEFYGLLFRVTPDTLIPRPETETLIDLVISEVEKRKLNSRNKKKITILDLGTGSGCIAITLAKNSRADNGSQLIIYASDISRKALRVAQFNAKNLKTPHIHFIESNLFQNIQGTFDIIIANLPYVPLADYIKLKSALKFEPRSAITDGSNTHVLIQKCITESKQRLNLGGILLLETDPSSKKIITKTVKLVFNSKPTYKNDLKKLTRYAIIRN